MKSLIHVAKSLLEKLCQFPPHAQPHTLPQAQRWPVGRGHLGSARVPAFFIGCLAGPGSEGQAPIGQTRAEIDREGHRLDREGHRLWERYFPQIP